MTYSATQFKFRINLSRNPKSLIRRGLKIGSQTVSMKGQLS